MPLKNLKPMLGLSKWQFFAPHFASSKAKDMCYSSFLFRASEKESMSS